MRLFSKVGITAVVVASLALTACGSSKSSGGSSNTGKKAQAASNLNDVNPLAYDQVATGGTLRWPIDSYPPNFNINEIDGNDINISNVMLGTLPPVWHFDAGGKPILDTDVVDKASQTSTSPQTIAYHINSKAVWSDGTPITYKDFVGMFTALNGTNKAYKPASTNGYDQIASVSKGATDQDVTVVFKNPYPDWQSLFSPIMPASLDATPTTFNTAWANGPTLSGGPFKISSMDKTAKTITVVRNDKWWGNPAKLDKIQYIVLDQSAQAKALQSNQVDFVDIGSDVATYATVKATPGVTIHKAGGPNWRHIDLGNSGPMTDVRVRQAVVLSINRVGDAKTLLGPLDWPATVLDSHIWMNNQAQYKATCGAFCNQDVAKADSLLTAAGYTKGSDGFYAKAGKVLNLNFIIPDGVKTSSDEAALQQKALQTAGIKVTIKSVPSDPFFPEYVLVGKFDLTIFSWIGTPFPISSAQSIYESNGDQNYAKIGNPQIDALYKQAVTELDTAKATDLTYQIDQKIWEEGHSVPLYQRPDLVASKSNLMNFGSFGFADTVYENIGFKK
ncbi:MAG: ABC transporter family substrate-binding protein [Actinomycetota bacterium]|nr:ABC transporter family substrate-binding protein [Actinomycetota bacterium]MDQ2957821.1 ABC transporter family substrate-binding protein [Actinomycetota bacterium]